MSNFLASMDWFGLISLIISTVFCGGMVGFVTLKEKKMQERERTKQTALETEKQTFDNLVKRAEFAEEHIVILHKRMTGMQNLINELMSRTLFAEHRICLKEECPQRQPKLGTFKSKHDKNETNQ